MSQGRAKASMICQVGLVAENLSMAVHQGNYYVLGGYGKFFPPQGCFLLTQIAHCVQGSVYALCMLT